MSLDLTLKNREIKFNVTNSREHKVYEFEEFRLDATTKLLLRGGEQVALTPKAVETLIALVEGRGKVIAKEDLMQTIWADTIVEESNLAQYLHVLRKTLGKTSDGKPYIETLKRRGYRFNGMVRVSTADGLARTGEVGIPNCFTTKKPWAAGSTSRRVERRGNVLAVADWSEIDEKPHPVSDQREPAVPPDRKIVYVVGLGVATAALLGLLAFIWFSSPAAVTEQASAVIGDLTITPLTNGETVEQATISPDGKYFAYVEHGDDSSRLWLQQVGESSRVETVRLPKARITDFTFSPDSSSLYYLSWSKGEVSNSLYRVGSLGGVPTKLLTGINGPVSFSPDGTEMVFVRADPDAPETGRGQLVIAASDASRQRILPIPAEHGLVRPYPAWSPDGKQVAFGVTSYEKSIGTCSIVAIDLAGGSIKSLSDEKWDSCLRTAWLADGSGLVFIGTKFKEAVTTRRDQVYHLSIAARSSRRVTNSGDRHEPSSLGVTRANEVLALPVNRVSHIWSLDAGADAQTAKQITTGQSDGRGGVEALPDGNVFYLSRTGDGFGIFRTDPAAVKAGTPLIADPTMEELRSSPDGRFLVFCAKVGGYGHLFRVDPDGTNRRQLTSGESNQVDSTVSPDGRWIVYASSFIEGDTVHYSLRKIPAEGGEPVAVLDGPCRTPHFSYDGRMISCIEGDTVRVVAFENGGAVKAFKTADAAVLNSGSRWTPDGQNLAYRVVQNGVTNLWLQPIGGGQPHPLTNFTHGDIYNFSFSPDGLRIYLARGNLIRNAVLIKGLV